MTPTIESTSPSALKFAELLGEGPLAKVALEASLASLDAPAFIVSASGTVLHTNPAGQKKVDEEGDALRPAILQAIQSLEDPALAGAPLVTPLRAGGVVYYLVIFRPPSSFEQRVDQAAALWELTPRQREVFALIAEGFSNKTIAVKLDCAERTVEAHITAILEKSGAPSRTALVAAVAK